MIQRLHGEPPDETPKCPFCDWAVEDHSEDSPHIEAMNRLYKSEQALAEAKEENDAIWKLLSELATYWGWEDADSVERAFHKRYEALAAARKEESQ